ncbi:SAM-dependent chlorinase/fluorinase [Pseudodesulfovibrio sp. zrk46]|uniref:SAM hydrolase/SAM-dependent halogenase family protein n=1 Tax=Pseudodesulfovibrio sp. zrk46 TaxID=2725288 RepID=UPI00144932E9|nr:SAM-dependent chlorinase/fluorinase [Pseudodesulfovibrio sp. zrk46]QJB55482.1 SAM-dependent chlorinase/fluorinase [Pseudodesulfovibrio sp. zrk46]
MFKSKKESPPPCTIGLLTDFGLSDPYVGQMKAVFANKAPACKVVDITHGVAPFNVAQAGLFLTASYVHFPKDSVILSVVDPGVGTDRRIVGLKLDDRLLIAPDNGLLSLALKTAWANTIRAFDLSRAMDAPEKVSHTFHGRDVFAPLTAWLALGGNPAGLGGEIDPSDLLTQDWSQPAIKRNEATAHVLHIDRFGNCVLNLEAGDIGNPANLTLINPAGGPLAYVTTYADMPEGAPGLLEGSQGFLEIAVNQSSAARRFGLSMGDTINLTWDL